MLQTNGSSKNLLLSMDIAENDEVGIIGGGGDREDETIEKSPSK